MFGSLTDKIDVVDGQVDVRKELESEEEIEIQIGDNGSEDEGDDSEVDGEDDNDDKKYDDEDEKDGNKDDRDDNSKDDGGGC